MKPTLLMARAVFPDVLDYLGQYFDVEANQEDILFSQDALIAKLQGKDALYAVSSQLVPAAVIAACPRLQMIGNMAVGFNNIDLAAATAAGILVSNTPDVLTETTADFAWALLMATARRVTESEHWLRAGKWDRWCYDGFLGADVHGATLGILGMGRIGQSIARRSMGFDMRVIYHNRSRLAESDEQYANNAQLVSKEELLRTADHLVLALPYSPAVHHTIGAAEIAQMQPGATLINIARGGIVDDVALIAALREHRIAAAGLDVYENEPAFHPDFLALSNVVLTPHIASASAPTRRAMAMCAARNLVAAFSGEQPPNLVNPGVTRKVVAHG